MENRELSALAEAIAGRIFVELEASGRHVHVTAQQALVLEQQVQARIWEMQERQAAMTTMS